MQERKVQVKNENALELIRLQIFHQYLLLRLDLQQLQKQTKKLRRSLIPKNPTNVPHLEGFINQTFRYQVQKFNTTSDASTPGSEEVGRDEDKRRETRGKAYQSERNSVPSRNWTRRFDSG